MNTKFLLKSFFIICSLMFASFSRAHAQEISSTYTGAAGDQLWSNPGNWDPQIVPNNNGSQTFDVFVDAPDWVFQDIDVTLNSLTLQPDDFTLVVPIDHNLTVAATNFGDNGEQYGGGGVLAVAGSSSVVCNLGNLTNFSGATLTGGNYVVITEGAPPGTTANVRFNGADIQTNSADIQFGGPDTTLTDEFGNDALRNLNHNLLTGIVYMEVGHNFTSTGSVVNEGEMIAVSEFGGFEAPTTLTINGNYTGVGFPPDGTDGLFDTVSAGPMFDAKTVIKGSVTNYKSATKTLGKSYWDWTAGPGRSAVTQVLGGSKPIDIVTSQASLNLFGPNTGFRDRYGNDALRNLTVSARLLVGNRTFNALGGLTSTSRLSMFGGTQFNVNGNLTIQSGFVEVDPLSGYDGTDGLQYLPPYLNSNLLVRGNFALPSATILIAHVYDHSATATISVKGAAVFAGILEAGVDDLSRITSADSFTVLTANKISGQFSNVPSGDRVQAYSDFDLFGNPVGDPVGSFLVTYNKTSLTLSDFQPSN